LNLDWTTKVHIPVTAFGFCLNHHVHVGHDSDVINAIGYGLEFDSRWEAEMQLHNV
jgi:hypothetical protein